MSKPEAQSRVEFGVNPYDDGSGFAQTVEVEHFTENGKEVKQIWIKGAGDACLLLNPDQWPALRRAVDRAVRIVFQG